MIQRTAASPFDGGRQMTAATLSEN